jgi:hypothetical protein
MDMETPHLSDVDVLCWIDSELSEARASEVRQHLAACEECRGHVEETERALEGLGNVYRKERECEFGGSGSRIRVRLRKQRAELSGARVRQIVAAAAAIVLYITIRNYSGETYAAAVPNVILTPGAISTISKQQVCSGQTSMNDPAIPDSLKSQVLREYGLAGQNNRAYEIDYLVTPQLGGAVTIRNLWPEPALQTVWNARAKDDLEDRLHAMVCHGDLDLATAQQELAHDWVAAYKKYFGTQRPRAVS